MISSFAQPYLISHNKICQSTEEIEEVVAEISLKQAREDRNAAEAKGFDFLREEIFNAHDNSFAIFISPPIQPEGYSITYLYQKKERIIEGIACINPAPSLN